MYICCVGYVRDSPLTLAATIQGNHNELTKHVMVQAAPKIYCYWRQVVCSAAASKASNSNSSERTEMYKQERAMTRPAVAIWPYKLMGDPGAWKIQNIAQRT